MWYHYWNNWVGYEYYGKTEELIHVNISFLGLTTYTQHIDTQTYYIFTYMCIIQ